jgi:hypothetical protein
MIKETAEAIDRLAPSTGLTAHIVSMPHGPVTVGAIQDALRVRALTHELGKLTGQSRADLQGPGAGPTQGVGDWGPHAAADVLGECGRPAVEVISAPAGEAGRDLNTTDDVRVANAADGWAPQLHERLKGPHGLEAALYARVARVNPVGPLCKRVDG